ncbi:hypothetical protein ES707_03381 [subsurface metagenome]
MVDLKEQVSTLTMVTGGRVPFTQEVWAGKIQAGLSLKYNEALKVFHLLLTEEITPLTFAKPLLAVGATVRLVDIETGLDTPWTLPAGSTLEVRMEWHSFNEPVRGRVYFDGFHSATAFADSLVTWYEQDIVTFNTAWVDPTGARPHTWDIRVRNDGVGACEGEIIQICITTTVGSPAVKGPEKLVQCKWCKTRFTVKREETIIRCRKCKKTFIIFNLP